MKTPEQIANEVCNAEPNDWAAAQWAMKPEDVRASIVAAIEADRAQRSPLIEAVAQVIEDRGSHAAAALIRDADPVDDLWNNYLGPMLDELEADYTKIAAEMEKEA